MNGAVVSKNKQIKSEFAEWSGHLSVLWQRNAKLYMRLRKTTQ